MKKSRQAKFPIKRTLLCVLTLLLYAMLMMAVQIKRLSQREFKYSQPVKSQIQPLKKQNTVYAEISIPEGKLWYESDGRSGAQYDWTIYNDTDFDFNDWNIKAQCIPGYRVDSIWAAKFSFEYSNKNIPPFGDMDAPDFVYQKNTSDNFIFASAPFEGYNIVIPAHGSIKFGMVMYLGKSFSPVNFFDSPISISGRHIYRLRQLRLFWLLLALIFITAAALITFISIKAALRRQGEEYERRKKYYHDIIIQSFKTFANFVDAKDPYTRGHSFRVGLCAREMGRRLNFNEEEQETLFWEGLMHDVGKISINDEILNKPGSLTEEEFNRIKSHCTNGYRILKDWTSMQTLKDVALNHHERYDGTGYPNGIRGEEIPLSARIIGVCDSFDAMNSDRCYRARLPKQAIIEEFRKGAGKQFDPRLAEIMIQMIQDGWADRLSKEPDSENRLEEL